MRSLADGLPAEVAQCIHPDWRKNEAEYWAARDGLLAHYADQWIGFADGGAITSGTSPVEVLHQAQASGRHPFVICVGREHEPARMRRVRMCLGSLELLGSTTRRWLQNTPESAGPA